MPLKNRITPTGEFAADPARGLFMGNRGILHDSTGRLTHRRWAHTNWIICLTNFKERRRRVMSPGHYTELFFLDEATALAAGHRPCCECRRQAYRQYWDALRQEMRQPMPDSAKELDRLLHQERAVPRRFEQRTHNARLQDLPDGTMFRIGADAPPLLRWRGRFHRWHFNGYGETLSPRDLTGDLSVAVLTPPTTVTALRGGYMPVVHPTAGR